MKESKIISLIEKKLKEFKGDKFSSTSIAKEILEENPESEIGISLQPLAAMVFNMHTSVKCDDAPQEKIEFDASDRSKYDVIDGNYVWESKRAGKISIPVSQIDEMFWDYSEHGMNMSQNEVRMKYNLTIPQFNSIKATLWMYKKGHIFSPYTVEHTDPLEMSQMVSDKMAEKYKNVDKIVKVEHSKETYKEYKRIIRQNAKREYIQQQFFEQLNALLPTVEKVAPVKVTFKSGEQHPEELMVAIADLHIGAVTEGLKITPDYNRDVLKNRLDKVAEEVNARGAKSVTLAILGDLIESFSGLNHMDSWKGLDLYGADVVVEAYDILSEFFEKINNLNIIKIVGGNHDRASANKKEDNTPTIAAIISTMLKRKYSGVYKIDYDNLVLDYNFGDNVKIIISHGDNNILKKSTSSFDFKVMEFGDPDKFNLVLTGHWHSRKIQEDKGQLRWYSTPSIFSGNHYSERNGWNSQPGYFIITEDKKLGKPIVMDCPL